MAEKQSAAIVLPLKVFPCSRRRQERLADIPILYGTSWRATAADGKTSRPSAPGDGGAAGVKWPGNIASLRIFWSGSDSIARGGPACALAELESMMKRTTSRQWRSPRCKLPSATNLRALREAKGMIGDPTAQRPAD